MARGIVRHFGGDWNVHEVYRGQNPHSALGEWYVMLATPVEMPIPEELRFEDCAELLFTTDGKPLAEAPPKWWGPLLPQRV